MNTGKIDRFYVTQYNTLKYRVPVLLFRQALVFVDFVIVLCGTFSVPLFYNK